MPIGYDPDHRNMPYEERCDQLQRNFVAVRDQSTVIGRKLRNTNRITTQMLLEDVDITKITVDRASKKRTTTYWYLGAIKADNKGRFCQLVRIFNDLLNNENVVNFRRYNHLINRALTLYYNELYEEFNLTEADVPRPRRVRRRH